MDPDARDQVTAARGAVRDAVSSLQNLRALLRSPKVGPRAISAVLPEMLEGLAPLGDDTAVALAEVRARVAANDGIDALVGHMHRSASELAAAVGVAATKDLDARARLTLEAGVERVAPSLDAGRWMIELLLAAAEETAATLDLAELLEEALAPSSQRGVIWGPTATVYLVVPKRGLCTVVASPRVAIPLMHAAVAQVRFAPGGERGRIVITSSCASDHAVIDVIASDGAAGAPTEALVVRAPVIVEATAGVLRVVAELSECHVVTVSPVHARVEFGRRPA